MLTLLTEMLTYHSNHAYVPFLHQENPKICLLTLSRAYCGLRILLSTVKPEVTKPDNA